MPKYCDCGKQANFNFPDKTSAKWCKDCKPLNAIDVIHKKCKCGKHSPCYNLPGKTYGIWCSECPYKPSEAVNVRDKRCVCGKYIPVYNLPGKSKPIWCSKCPDKPIEAIDVKNKKCECGQNYPVYSLPGKKILKWCSKCPNKPENAIDNKHLKCECGIIACYNLPGEVKGKWCSKCKPKEAIDIKNKMCKQCNLVRTSNPKYRGYCLRCFIHLFPDEPTSTNFRIKEKYVLDELMASLSNDIEIIRDKTVGGCSLRRPDLMMDMGSHWICIENDENCHKNYDTVCENKRIMELYTDMANRPMILIRFNCDKYSGGQSLFKKHPQSGVDVIRSKKEFKERINKLAEMVNVYIGSEPPDKAITVEYLYYDQ